jgi:transketolase
MRDVTPRPRSAERASQREAYGHTLIELVEGDDRVVLLDGDLADSTRADLLARAHPERFFQMGIAEQNMVGVAAGMATLGLVPWCSSLACFVTNRDLDQIRVVVAQPSLNVKFAAGYAGLAVGRPGKTHQEISDLAVMRAMPHMTVLAPADAPEARLAMYAANEFDGPVYIRLMRDPEPIVFADDHVFEIGHAVRLRDGDDVALIATGSQTARTLEAAEILASAGVSALVLHVATLKPLDVASIVEAAEQTGRVVTAEEHTIIGGLGGAVAETLAEHHPTPMRRVGILDTFGQSASTEDLMERYKLTARSVATAAMELIDATVPISSAPRVAS